MSEASDGGRRGPALVYWWSPRGDERVFDLSSWPEDAVETTKALLERDGLEHRWDGASLVVDGARRQDAAAILDEVVAASEPRLDEGSDRTAYDLAGWPDYELETLEQALQDEEIVHEWTNDGELLVQESDEARVDELFDRLDLRGPDPGIELDGEELIQLLTGLFTASDKLSRDPSDPDAVLGAHRAILEVEQLAVPYGMDPDGWAGFVEQARELRGILEDEAEAGAPVTDDDVADSAGRVRDVLKRML